MGGTIRYEDPAAPHRTAPRRTIVHPWISFEASSPVAFLPRYRRRRAFPVGRQGQFGSVSVKQGSGT